VGLHRIGLKNHLKQNKAYKIRCIAFLKGSLNRYRNRKVDFMAYMGYCLLCHHLHADVQKRHLEEFFIDHSAEAHKDMVCRFVIVRISAEAYKRFLENRDNPKFWEAWRNIKKKPKFSPFLCKGSGEISLFCKPAE